MNGDHRSQIRSYTPLNQESIIYRTNYNMPLGGNQYKSNPVISVQFDHVNKNRQNVLNQRTEDASRPERLTQRSTPSSSLDKPETTQDTDGELSPSSIYFFSANTTFHGISHFIQPGFITVRRLLWGVAFFVSLFGLLTQGYDRYSYYISHPHVTKLDEEEAMEMVFPAVTICNMNPFRLSQINTNDYYYLGTTLLGLFEPDYSLKRFFHDNKTWPKVEEKISSILDQGSDYRTRLGFNLFEFYDRTGHSFNDVVKTCKYRGKKCKPEWWLPSFTRYGKCYTFNSGKTTSGKKIDPLKTLKGGVDNGLELLLDTEQDDYMPVWAETDEISIEAGFKVQIHVQLEPPFIHELGFGISPGFQTLVATQEQRITFLPDPYGDCISRENSSSEIYEDYSISACRIVCEKNYVMAKCNCRMIHMPGDGRYCTPEEYKSCADPALDYLVNEDEQICVCSTPCEVTRYNLEMSTLQLPSTQAVSYLASKYQKTEDYVRNNFAKLNIFFEALNYETIEQKKAYELPGLFGDIGGQMGLFIGASILTILELFDYVYEVVKDKTWGRKRRKESSHNSLLDKNKNHVTNTDGLQDLEHSHNPSYDTRGSDKQPYTSYSHLSPLPEYFSLRKKAQDHHQQEISSALEMDGRPNLQYLGNSCSIHKNENPQDEKLESSFFLPRAAFQYDPPGRNREVSMSYNDLYRPPTGNWAGDDSSTVMKPQLSCSAMGYTMPLTPMTATHIARPNEGLFMDVGMQREPGSHTRSLTRTIAPEFPDFSLSTKETEIH